MSSKMTLLEIVQDILNDMDSDEVNSIGDTVESSQVAQIVKTTYYELFGSRDLPEHQVLGRLDSLGDTDRPNYLKIPENVRSIKWIKYNGVDVQELDPEEYVDRVLRNEGVEVEDFNGVSLPCKTDGDPKYWTSFDDTHVIFDSFDLSAESTLQQSNNMFMGYKDPAWDISDDFVPEIDATLFPLLVAEAKDTCFMVLKQMANAKAGQQSRRQLLRTRNDRWRAGPNKETSRGPDYGRRRR